MAVEDSGCPITGLDAPFGVEGARVRIDRIEKLERIVQKWPFFLGLEE